VSRYVIAVIKYRVRGAKVIEPKSEDNNKTCKRWTYVQVKLLHSECRGEILRGEHVIMFFPLLFCNQISII